MAALEERTRERRDEEGDRRTSEGEQQQVPDLLAPHRAIRNPLEEHERRKFDDDLSLAVDKMDDHRDGDRRETGEKGGGEKIHKRLPDPAELLARDEIVEQRLIEGLRRVEQRIVGAGLADAA